MKYLSFLQFCFVVIVNVCLIHVPAYSNELPDGIQDFVHSYLAAAKQNNIEGIRKLSHHAFIKCSVEGETDEFVELVKQQIKAFSREDPIMKIRYLPFSNEELKKIAKSMEQNKKKWPVRPDGRIIIIYSSFHKASKMPLIVARDKQGWRWVHFCKQEIQEETSSWLWGNDLD